MHTVKQGLNLKVNRTNFTNRSTAQFKKKQEVDMIIDINFLS